MSPHTIIKRKLLHTDQQQQQHKDILQAIKSSHDAEVVNAVLHFISHPDLYCSRRRTWTLNLKLRPEGQQHHNSKGAHHNHILLQLLSIWDTLCCRPQEERVHHKNAAAADAAYRLAHIAEKLLYKLLATKDLLPNSRFVSADRSIMMSSFAKTLRFDTIKTDSTDSCNNKDLFLHFCELLHRIMANVRDQKRIAFHCTTGGTDVFVNFLRLLESQNLEDMLVGDAYTAIQALERTIGAPQDCIDEEGGGSSTAESDDDHDERLVYQQMIQQCIERAKIKSNKSTSAANTKNGSATGKRKAFAHRQSPRKKKTL